MAVYYVGNSNKGLADGSSPANCYSMASWIAVLNAMGALINRVDAYIIEDITTSATLNITKAGTTVYPITHWGMNAAGTASELRTVSANGGSFSVITVGAVGLRFYDLHATDTTGANNCGFTHSTSGDYATFVRCQASACDYGFLAFSGAIRCKYIDCVASANRMNGFHNGNSGAQGYGGVVLHGCRATGNGSYGFANFQEATRCIANGNVSVGFANVQHLDRGVAYGNGSHGAGLVTVQHGSAVDCVFYGNAGYGCDGSAIIYALDHCAYGNNTSGIVGSYGELAAGIVLTADPFVDAANNDFTLARNSTCLGAASDGGDIGAWQRPFNRIAQPVLIGV